jgi:hypothetical protein
MYNLFSTFVLLKKAFYVFYLRYLFLCVVLGFELRAHN